MSAADLPEIDEQQASRAPGPEHEAAYNRAARRAVIAVIAVILVVFVAAGIIGTKAISRRFAGARNLDEARQLLNDADPTVLDIDQAVRAEASAEVAQQARSLLARIPDVTEQLARAVRLVDAAMESVTDDEQQQAKLLRAAAVARERMLDPAVTILDATAKAGDALKPAEEGWKIVAAAERLADDSVRQYNLLTKAGVTASSKLALQAKAELERARPYFSEAATAFPEAGFDRYTRFIDAKVELLELSRQSNALWLAGKVTEANKLIARYNVQDKTVVALAAELPDSTGAAIADAYERLAGAATTEYFDARKAATKADAELDEF